VISGSSQRVPGSIGAMRGTTRIRSLRWLVPVAGVAAIALAASGVLTASAKPTLPPKTAAALLVDVQNPNLAGFSGTIVQKSDLGLPIPPAGRTIGGEDLVTALTSSHTMRVWDGGRTRQRVAVLDPLGESDAVRNGRDLWLWSSSTRTATQYRLPAEAAKDATPEQAHPGLTPQQAADQALKAIDPTTVVTTDGTSSVAGRAAYELVLAPRDTRSLIGQVRLAVDAATHLPLRVQVYARSSGARPPAFEVGFTRISYAVPGDEQFRFTPPPGVTVKQGGDVGSDDSATPGHRGDEAQADSMRLVGRGWTAVAAFTGVPTSVSRSGGGRDDSTAQLAAVLSRLPKVSGAWGSGRLLTSSLASALLTDDGRLYVGAVAPDLLYAAAAHR
jgi:outer membrane lipoprotein-sorting protein